MPKYKYSQIRKIFADKGCELLTPESEYKNLTTKVRWKCGTCPEGNNIKETTPRSFKIYGRCRLCGIKSRKRAGPKKGTLKHSYSAVKETFEKEGCQLLTSKDKYGGAKAKVRWICKCQKGKNQPKVQVSSFSCFKTYKRCRSCGIKESKGNRGSYGDFCQLLEKENWKMVSPESEYQNTKTRMRIRTPDGYEWFTTYNRFHQGHRVIINEYGWVNPMQTLEGFNKQQKSAFSLKSYTFPSGREVFVQGYEPRCLDYLQQELKISEDDITVDHKKMPSIWYRFGGKRRRYYPDVYIISQNLLIEVKSPYTYKLAKEQNLAKWRATARICPLRVYIFDAKKLLETRHYSGKRKVKIRYKQSPRYPPNFDFEEKWISHCVPHLKQPEILKAYENGINLITEDYPCGHPLLKKPMKYPS